MALYDQADILERIRWWENALANQRAQIKRIKNDKSMDLKPKRHLVAGWSANAKMSMANIKYLTKMYNREARRLRKLGEFKYGPDVELRRRQANRW